MKLGIGTYAYMWSIGFPGLVPAQPMTAMDLLHKARELGVKLVQYGPNLPLARSESDLDRLLDQARAWEIELELGTRGLETGHLRQQVALAQRIGAAVLRTIPEVDGQTPPLGSIPSYLQAILPVLESTGVRLGLENGKIPAADLRGILEGFASPHLGVVLDTANSLAVPEGWKEVTRELAPFTVCLHLKEFVVRRVWSMMGFTVEGRPSGKGQVDIPWLLDTVQSTGARFNVVIETWPPEQKTPEETIALEQDWTAESVRYLRTLIPD